MPPSKICCRQWDGHKETICQLYKNMTLTQVIKFMADQHGFHASPNQYTKKLREWGYGKRDRDPQATWRWVEHKIKRREDLGKDSQVEVDGRLVSPKKVRKEISRYALPNISSFPVTSPKTPSGNITVQTPPSDAISLPLLPPVTSFSQKPTTLSNLAWFEFDNIVTVLSRYHSACIREQSDDLQSQVSSWFRNSPSSPYLIQSDDQQMINELETLWNERNSIADPDGPNIPRFFDSSQNSFLKEIHDVLKELQLNPDVSLTFALPFLRPMIYLASNNLLELKHPSDILEWINNSNALRLVKLILRTGTATGVSFFNFLAYYAIQADNEGLVRRLLELRCDDNGHPIPATVTVLDTFEEALSYDRAAVVQSFLTIGIDFELVNDIDRLLLWSVEHNDAMTAAASIAAGADLEVDASETATLLQHAVSYSSVEIMEILLQAGANPNTSRCSRDDHREDLVLFLPDDAPFFQTPLMLATDGGNKEKIKILLQYGADPNFIPAPKDESVWPEDDIPDCLLLPLQRAVQLNDTQISELLLQGRARPSMSAFKSSSSPLRMAIEMDRPDAASLMMNYLSIEDRDSAGWKTEMLQLAMLCGDTDVTTKLLHEYLGISTSSPTALPDFSRMNLVEEVLRNGINIDTTNRGTRSFLWTAIRNNNTQLLRSLLACGADPDNPTRGDESEPLQPPISIAMRLQRDDMVRLLISYGANINGGVLASAVKNASHSWVKRLLDEGADPNVPHQMPMSRSKDWVCSSHPIEFKDRLVKFTEWLQHAVLPISPLALSAACESGRSVEMARLLISAGAAVEPNTGIPGPSPLEVASLQGHLELVRYLLDVGANPNAKRFDTYSMPLPTAVESALVSGCLEVFYALLAAGADGKLNRSSIWVQQALEQAVMAMDLDLCQTIISHGASVNVPSLFRWTHGLPLISSLLSRYNFPSCVHHRPWLEEPSTGCLLGLGIFSRNHPADIFDWLGIVSLLLDAGADVTKVGRDPACGTALALAIQSFQWPGQSLREDSENHGKLVSLVHRLLDLGAPVDDTKCTNAPTALGNAVSIGSIPVVEMLLPKLDGPDSINRLRSHHLKPRKTLLQIAVSENNMEIVQVLLSHGADVNAHGCPDRGATALQLAAMNGNVAMARILLEHGADINAPAAVHGGRTALEEAAENGRLDMVILLLENDQSRDIALMKSKCEQAAMVADRRNHVIARVLRDWRITP